MLDANHSRVRLFARKRTNECNANATTHICERQVYECMRWDNAHFSATMVCGPHTLPPRRADHSVIN